MNESILIKFWGAKLLSKLTKLFAANGKLGGTSATSRHWIGNRHHLIFVAPPTCSGTNGKIDRSFKNFHFSNFAKYSYLAGKYLCKCSLIKFLTKYLPLFRKQCFLKWKINLKFLKQPDKMILRYKFFFLFQRQFFSSTLLWIFLSLDIKHRVLLRSFTVFLFVHLSANLADPSRGNLEYRVQSHVASTTATTSGKKHKKFRFSSSFTLLVCGFSSLFLLFRSDYAAT